MLTGKRPSKMARLQQRLQITPGRDDSVQTVGQVARSVKMEKVAVTHNGPFSGCNLEWFLGANGGKEVH
jgi:hypothetical protein